MTIAWLSITMTAVLVTPAKADDATPLIKELGDKSWDARRQAVQKLGALGAAAKSAVLPLSGVLARDTNFLVRRAAAQALGKIGPEARAAVPGLIAAMRNDKEDAVRVSATFALGKLGPAAGVFSALMAASHDREAAVRHAAAIALGQFPAEHKTIVPAMMDLIKDPATPLVFEDEATGLAAVRDQVITRREVSEFGKKKFEIPRPINVRGAMEPVRRAAALTLALMPPITETAADSLARGLLNAKNAEAREIAVCRILGEYGPAAKVAAAWLADELVKAKSAELRAACAETLGRIGPLAQGVGAKPLAAALKDADINVRLAAADALTRVAPSQTREALTTLVILIGDQDESRRMAAAEVLGAIGETAAPALTSLVNALRDSVAGVRANAATAMGGVGAAGEPFVKSLEALLNDDNCTVRNAAAGAMGRIAVRSPETVAPALIQAYKSATKPVDPLVVIAALARLRAATPEVLELYSQHLADPDMALRLACVQAVGTLEASARSTLPALVANLKDPDPEVLVRAAVAINRIDPALRDGINNVVDALHGADAAMAQAVREQLADLGSEVRPFIRSISEKLADKDEDVRLRAAVSLLSLAPRDAADALKLLNEGLANGDTARRIKTCEAIARIGPAARSTETALTKLRRDKDLEVVAAATKALEAIRSGAE